MAIASQKLLSLPFFLVNLVLALSDGHYNQCMRQKKSKMQLGMNTVSGDVLKLFILHLTKKDWHGKPLVQLTGARSMYMLKIK